MGGNRDVDDAMESKGTDEVNIKIRCSDHSKFLVQISLESTVKSFKEAIAQKCDISSDYQRLIHRGRILKDDKLTLKSYGLEDGDTVYLARRVAPAATTNTTAGTKGSTNSTRRPRLTRDQTKRVAMRRLMHNTGTMRDLIMSNPQIFNDPHTLRQNLKTSRNSRIMREMMRNLDRAMSNIEASPEGFNMLRRMYEEFEDSFLNATMMAGSGTQGGQASNQSTNSSSTGSEAIAGSPSPNTSPLPNPWTSSRAGLTQNNTTRSTSGGNVQAPTALELDLPEPQGLAVIILDRTLFTRLMQNPNIPQMRQSIDSNPEAVIQILRAYSQLCGVPDMTPYFIPLILNTEAIEQALSSQLGQQQSTQESGRATGVQDPMVPRRMKSVLSETLSNMFRRFGSSSPTVTNNKSDEPPEQLYATQLSQLQEMGFSNTQENIRALSAASGDAQAAVKWLLEKSCK